MKLWKQNVCLSDPFDSKKLCTQFSFIKFLINVCCFKYLLNKLPCWVSWTTEAGNVFETATGVTPTPDIFTSAPSGKLVTFNEVWENEIWK